MTTLHRRMAARSLALLVACVGCKGAPVAEQCPPPTAQSAAPLVTQSQAPPAPPDTFDVAAIDDCVARQMTPRRFVGLSVAVVKDGAIVLEKGYGQSRLAPDVAVRPETAFLVGSVSKQFVCAIVLQLADEKKLSLDDEVAKYFPDLTRAADITLYDLMTHVSGYRDDYPLDFVDQEMKQPVTPDESIARHAKLPLDFEPRTRFSYSSTGYKILGRVIEKVTGKPLGVVMEERILRPLGMTHSSYMPDAEAPGLARGYTSFALGPPEPAVPEGRGWHFGSSGIHAPAGDLARWDLALMSGKVLDAKAYALFTTPRRLVDGRTTGYGCGVWTITKGGEEILQHGGGDAGFVAASWLLPRTRSAVVVLSNRDDTRPWDLLQEIAALVTKEHRPPLPKVEGPPIEQVAREMLAALQSGKLDRRRLGDDFDAFLTEAKLQGATARLRPLGAPTEVRVDGVSERGAMEASTVHFTFTTTKLEAVMFRSLDGKVQQFLIEP